MSFVCPRISPKGSILVLSTRALPLNLVFKMSNQITPLHPVASGSRRTSAPRNDSSANSRFACRTISTASFKFARASSSVAPCVFAPGSSSLGKFSENRSQLDFHVDLVAQNTSAGQLRL